MMAKEDRAREYIRITLIVLGIVLVVLVGLLIHEYFTLRREHAVSARELSLSTFVRKHGPLTASEVGVVRSWMTFDYVNRIFALPPSYLGNALGITDPDYPHLTLAYAAYGKGVSPADFMTTVEHSIADYLSGTGTH